MGQITIKRSLLYSAEFISGTSSSSCGALDCPRVTASCPNCCACSTCDCCRDRGCSSRMSCREKICQYRFSSHNKQIIKATSLTKTKAQYAMRINRENQTKATRIGQSLPRIVSPLFLTSLVGTSSTNEQVRQENNIPPAND